MLTTEQIKEVLGSSNPRPKILTDDDKVRILEMVDEGCGFEEIVSEIQETNEKVKKEHIKNYLKRQLKKLEKESK